jgi:hypothetical protein
MEASARERAMPNDYKQDDLTARLTKPGWQHTDASGVSETGTLRDMATKAHTDRARHPGVVKEIETAVELELIQLQQLWHYLGLPD